MTTNIQTIIDNLSKLTVLEVSELVSGLESAWGVSAASVAVAAPAGNQADQEQAKEKEDYQVVIVEIGQTKINVIKEVRAITGLGLVEAKALVDGAPSVVKESVKKADAENMKKQLEAAGAKVELK